MSRIIGKKIKIFLLTFLFDQIYNFDGEQDTIPFSQHVTRSDSG